MGIAMQSKARSNTAMRTGDHGGMWKTVPPARSRNARWLATHGGIAITPTNKPTNIAI